MKNKLAENMLRFGVKNLSESSKRKLTEAPAKPIQPYAVISPKSLKFADQATFETFLGYPYKEVYARNYDEALAGKYGMWCLEKGNGQIYGPPSEYKLKDGYYGTMQIIAQEIAQACAVQGRTVCGAFRTLKTAEAFNLDAYQKLKNADLYINRAGGSDCILGQDMGLQGRRYKINQSNWDYIFKDMESAINKVLATYTLPVAPAAPATAAPTAAKPGATPVKKP
jgi:hypothetical protein